MFSRKKKNGTLKVSGKGKKDGTNSEPGFHSKAAFLKENKSSTSLSFKEKMMRKQMKKFAAEMQLPHEGPFAAGVESEDQKIVLQQLQQQNEALSSRCRKLEAQNVIAAAQAVDFLNIIVGLVSSIITYFVYGRTVWWLLDYKHFSSWIGKTIFLVLPYVYNKMNYGVIYRRFQVFAVFVIFVTRMKLVRWRAAKYTKSEDDGKDTNVSSLRGGSASTSHFGDDITAEDIWEANYEINARYLYSSILRLRGLWTKTAQYLSSRADFVPIAYVRELSKLQDEAPETPWDDVHKMLSKAGILEHFSHVEQTPIASASIGQVHIARLKNTDDDVVIKVQHPHALTLLSDDLVSLNIMAWIIGILEPEYKFFGILMREWATEARKELDFMSEVDNLETARESIKQMNSSTPMMTNHSDECVPFSVEIPRPFKALSSKRVMVMTFCEGKRVDDLDQINSCNVPKEAIMNALAQTFAYMMYVADIFNGDPHPGNLFIRPGLMSREKNSTGESHGFTIVLLDWGLAKRLPESKRAGFCQMTYAAATFDFGLMMDGFKTLGLKLKRENVAEDMEGVRFMLRDMAPRETARKRLKAKMKTDMKRSKEKKKGERVPVESNAYPGEFFFFVRTNELLHGLGSKLGVDMKYLDILKPYAEKGIRGLDNYKSVSKVPDPLATDMVEDINLKKQIETALHDLEGSGRIAGAQVCVVKNDKMLAHSVTGNLGSLKSHLPVRSDTIFLGFSVTKATAATLANRMVEEGYLELDEPISKRIWPDFCPSFSPPAELLDALDDDDKESTVQKWHWKRSITLRHILTHTTGLWFATPSNLTIKNLASCETCSKGFEYIPEKPGDTILPLSEPGTECKYQYLSFGWLVAGCVIGAYSRRHGKRSTYKDIYDEILGHLHSPEMKKAGFRPCGGGGDAHDIALVDTELDITRAMQMRREAEAMGELMEDLGGEGESDELTIRNQLMKGIKGREFILDPRIWNSEDAINANVPAAGGRFSAKALAMFYHELGNGKILSPAVLSEVTAVSSIETGLQSLQGQTSIANGSVNDQQKSEFGLGYQIIRISDAKDGFAFGHAGVGGSIGFHHVSSNTSIGIMFNKVGENRDSAKEIINIVSRHLNW